MFGLKGKLLLLLVIGLALLGFRHQSIRHGRNLERQRQQKRLLQNIETKRRIEHEVETLDSSALHERARRWVREPGTGDD